MRKKVVCTLLAVIFAVMGTLLVACGSGGGLSGTWGASEADALDWGRETRIEFVGNRFTLTTSRMYRATFGGFWRFDDADAPPRLLTDRSSDSYSSRELISSTTGHRLYHLVFQGTYTISDGDTIELVFDGGAIQVSSFSQTENTITIGGIRAYRR